MQDASRSWDDGAAAELARLRSVVEQLPAFVDAVEGPELRLVALSALSREHSQRPEWRGLPLAEVYPELVSQGVLDVYRQVVRTGRPFATPEWRFELVDPVSGEVTELVLDWSAVPWRRPDGTVDGVISLARDVTEQVQARRRAEREAAEAGQRYRAVLDVVTELQHALLPGSVPVLPRVDVAARDLVAGAEQSAGGDWLDVRPLPDGRVGLAVGDVVGHGVAAAAVMSQLRAVLGDSLDTTADPAAAVARLERFAETLPGARSATLVVAVLDPEGGTIDYVTRGHPPPLVVDASGVGRLLLGSGGGPLGSGPGGPPQRAPLGPGDVVVLYSDGLVERADRSYPEGLDELTRLAEAAAVGQLWPTGTSASAVERICTDAVEVLVRRGWDDDVTVLAAAPREPVAVLRTSAAATEEALPRLRSGVREWLRALRVDPGDELAVELAVGEAVDNAVEHGFRFLSSGTVVVALRLGADGRVHVRVDDDGIWQPPGDRGDRGTGLGLVHSLGDDLCVDGQPSGTTVTFSRRLCRPVSTALGAGTARVPPPATDEPFTAELDGEPPVLRVRGAVDAFGAARFREHLDAASRAGTVPVVVDLTGVGHLTSVGVAALTDLLRDAPDAVTLVAPTGSPAAFVLDLVGLPRRPAAPG
ncbi:Serine phosphatase RsbU, regulator of sigma subunit [Geodermatophilus dictyosporus]|uniref:Serine phosphatase RsbU, regulator of sigma subunit n=1 Tax=Geodermatophilus dictyosporus TaxID=1523247 RepID=A0A1I5PD05_9ACTN|nr:SpoIIE family protein phosphatase [Geodermatophilus dictyosporus]SFP31925.1 Serine phosphatase RsbU, regulator of sigma subunit [Geodermatophilus dictyosporus]